MLAQLFAAFALAQDPRPLSKIKSEYLKAYAKQEHEDRQALIADLVAQLDDKKAVEMLSWIACNDPDEDVRIEAVRGFKGKLEDKAVQEALVAVVLEGHVPAKSKILEKASRGGGATPALRRETAAVLRDGAPDGFYTALGEALTEKPPKKPKKGTPPDLTVHALRRALAAELLGDVGGAEAVKRLESAMDDPDLDVKIAIARALGYTYRPEARDALKKWKNAEWPRLKAEAAAALARLDAWEKADSDVAPDEIYREKDTPASVELLFLVDSGHAMKGLIPSVVRQAKMAIEDVKKKTDKPIRAAVVTMHFGEEGPEFAVTMGMTEDLSTVVPAIQAIETDKKPAPAKMMWPFEAGLRLAAYRLPWSRNSEKRIFAFTSDRSVDLGPFTRALAADLKQHERAELYIHHTERGVPMDEIAKAGAGRAEELVNAVPAAIVVILRGASANDVKLLQETFKIKRKPALDFKATATYRVSFDNESSLDLDELGEIERTPIAGIDEMILFQPNLTASTYTEVTLEIVVKGDGNPKVAEAYAAAQSKPWEVRGVADVVVDYPMRKMPKQVDEPPTAMVAYEAKARIYGRAEASQDAIKQAFKDAGFTTVR